MSVLIVLPDARRRGPQKTAGLIASALKEHRPVRILCKEGGELVTWLGECAGQHNIRVLDSGDLDRQRSFRERTQAAQAILREEPSDIVYVNSLAASEFVVAAKAVGKYVVLHVYETAAEMRSLLAQQLTKFEILTLCDAVVLAADTLRFDLLDVFAAMPERALSFGSVVEWTSMARLARDRVLSARTATGLEFRPSDRLLVGMIGEASERKGCSTFFETAMAVPEHDFMWVGGWDSSDSVSNPALSEFLQAQLPNFFVTGSVDNPYKYIAAFDLFFLSSQRDPDPLVLAEALALAKPVLAFSKTTSVADYLGRTCILCHGEANPPDAIRVLKAMNKREMEMLVVKKRPREIRQRFDIRLKITGMLDLLASLGA